MKRHSPWASEHMTEPSSGQLELCALCDPGQVIFSCWASVCRCMKRTEGEMSTSFPCCVHTNTTSSHLWSGEHMPMTRIPSRNAPGDTPRVFYPRSADKVAEVHRSGLAEVSTPKSNRRLCFLHCRTLGSAAPRPLLTLSLSRSLVFPGLRLQAVS